jgi:hypothetical protein
VPKHGLAVPFCSLNQMPGPTLANTISSVALHTSPRPLPWLAGGGSDRATVRRVPHNQSYSRAALTSAFNSYQSSFFELTQRPAFRIRLDTPFPQHQVGNEEAAVTPQPLEVPQRQSD